MSLFGFLKHKENKELDGNPFASTNTPPPPTSKDLSKAGLNTLSSGNEQDNAKNEYVDDVQALLEQPATQNQPPPELSNLSELEQKPMPQNPVALKSEQMVPQDLPFEPPKEPKKQKSSPVAYTKEEDYVDLVSDALYISKDLYKKVLWDLYQLKKKLEQDYNSLPSTEAKEVAHIQDAIQAHAAMQAALIDIDQKLSKR